MPPSVGDVNVAKSITTGFGNTLSSIDIVIGFGVMMGRGLEVSGAAVAMITSASITAPILANLSVNPLIAAQAATIGAMIIFLILMIAFSG
ncbi:GntP family permease [Thermovorax subterraneus]|nr:GntP family permease [Thermovorax subterraneus]